MAAEKSWTHEKKLALSKVVENLPVNEHPHIYRIILARDPDTLEDCEDDPAWAYIHFHLLSLQTLRELEDYIASRSVNTQSEIKENNPNEHIKEESNPNEHVKEESNPNEHVKEESNPNEHVKEESNPNEHVKEEKNPKSASNSKKTPSSKGAKGSAENTGDVSIKARLRRSSRKSDANHSKQD